MSSYRKRDSLKVGDNAWRHQLSWTPLGRRASFLVIGGEDARMCGYKDKLEMQKSGKLEEVTPENITLCFIGKDPIFW